MSDLRIGDLVVRNARVRPDAVALIEPRGRLISWAELDAATDGLAGGLSALGLRRGDRVATILRNGVGSVEALYGLAKAGLLAVPINYGLTPGEVGVILADSRPHAIVADAGFDDAYAAEIAAHPVPVIVRGSTAVAGGRIDYDALVAGGGPYDRDAPHADDVRTIRYTSGTTAAPKGCLGTHRQILASIENFFGELDVPQAPFLQLFPLFSGAGIWMNFAAAYHGVANVVPAAFQPAEALAMIGEHGVGHACGVPTMLARLCDEYEKGGYDVSSLKLFGYTGSPMPPSVIRKALRLLPWRFYQGFGGGELGGLVSFLKPDDHDLASMDGDTGAARLATVGRPARYATVEVRDLSGGHPLPAGEAGEVTVCSPSNFAGYHNRPDETARTLRGAWVHTGDVGYFDGEGCLRIIDRVKDMVLTGGMNVSSAEVEGVLMDHPGVKLAAVFGMPDDEWGELVTAAVVRAEGAEAGEADLIAYARTRLAGYKAPKAIRFVDALPMNSAGKILKRELRTRFAPVSS
jgi:acyl-CoA synthetase (AMP-forming)/AMP-acid ligase II